MLPLIKRLNSIPSVPILLAGCIDCVDFALDSSSSVDKDNKKVIVLNSFTRA